MNPMARARVYTRLAAAVLLLAGVTAAGAAEPPAATIEPTMTRGPAAAPVTILEWSDFQCPFCRQAQDTMARLLGEFPDSVRLVFKDFPLRSHEGALPAALAARCAGAQGRFWEYHDLLFVAQPAFAREELLGYARRLGLDLPRFTECLDAARFRDAVAADQREGRARARHADLLRERREDRGRAAHRGVPRRDPPGPARRGRRAAPLSRRPPS
jgi:protein-disulfide isomerase